MRLTNVTSVDKMNHFANVCKNDSLLKKASEDVSIESQCDLDNKHYFNKNGNRGYTMKVPGIFRRRERRDYSINVTLEYPNEDFTKNYFTIEEYMSIINVLWKIPNGSYNEQLYFDKINSILKSEDFANFQEMSSVISKILIEKGIIDSVKKIKTWYEPSWSQKSQDKLDNMFFSNISDNDICLGLRIVFAQKSFGCFIVT